MTDWYLAHGPDTLICGFAMGFACFALLHHSVEKENEVRRSVLYDLLFEDLRKWQNLMDECEHYIKKHESIWGMRILEKIKKLKEG